MRQVILPQKKTLSNQHLQDILQVNKQKDALSYACHALHLALFGSAEDWQSIRDEVRQMQRKSPCSK